jgi:hypothetical protein
MPIVAVGVWSRQQTKGSDASNVFDEEVDEDAVEYSDDEEEAAAKRRKKVRTRARVWCAISRRWVAGNRVCD